MDDINAVREKGADMIPADAWPEWADRHCWDEDGDGIFYGAYLEGNCWVGEFTRSSIPLPPGHDWRVPVMRQTAKECLTVDLEQLQRLASGWIIEAGGPGADAQNACAEALLALIDGQARPFVCTGDELRCLDGNGCECRMRGLGPTNGEGE